ncbi:hypothetical protein NicSoilB11_40370 [Arthrobacter sp. NicSoilB11]|nr:hypothetical protein StoSoilB19_39810 [Arthrobacter sp. StoSoilB19]BCW77712.1 hypothetical protein NicSoilB11_40370 [Arthrobacter sp. NicSoilB11]
MGRALDAYITGSGGGGQRRHQTTKHKQQRRQQCGKRQSALTHAAALGTGRSPSKKGPGSPGTPIMLVHVGYWMVSQLHSPVLNYQSTPRLLSVGGGRINSNPRTAP